MQDSPTAPPAKTVAELEAELQAAREAEANATAEQAHADLSLESLDARLSEVERRLNGGATE